jgi:hypothetical protein
MELSEQLYASLCPFYTHHAVVETNSIQFCTSMFTKQPNGQLYRKQKLQTNNKQTKSRHEQDTISKCYNYNDKTGKGNDVPVEALKAYDGLEAQLYSFLTSGLGESQWLGLCPGCFTPQ